MIPKWLESTVEHIQNYTEETKKLIPFSWFLYIFQQDDVDPQSQMELCTHTIAYRYTPSYVPSEWERGNRKWKMEGECERQRRKRMWRSDRECKRVCVENVSERVPQIGELTQEKKTKKLLMLPLITITILFFVFLSHLHCCVLLHT